MLKRRHQVISATDNGYKRENRIEILANSKYGGASYRSATDRGTEELPESTRVRSVVAKLRAHGARSDWWRINSTFARW